MLQAKDARLDAAPRPRPETKWGRVGHWWLGLCRPRLHSLTDSDAAHSQRDHRGGAGPTAGSRRNLANDSEGSHSTPGGPTRSGCHGCQFSSHLV